MSQNSGKTAHIWVWTIVISLVIVGIVIAAESSDNDDDVVITGGGLFGSRGAEHLVERLNDATRTQRICYGWVIDTDTSWGYDEYTTPVRPANPAVPLPPSATDVPVPGDGETDVGSNLGTGLDPRDHPRQCPKWVVFTASYQYDILDEEWTSVVTDIDANLPVGLSDADLTRAGITRADLLGAQANARLADAVGALPMIVAEKGAAPPVPQTAASAPTSGDRATPPGIARYVWMAVGGTLIAVGLIWIVFAVVRSRRSA
ncbi:hypothetical protein [Thermomonospora cellulosilytica]|uniref:Uncharacterized protein n=1 Tax=Thermomonospora cellulosilytica TaxID=1411118 RepID=A0A7W3MXP5_9ACTN|nr:hypothetical protein [Thermomonospora cellulosilytica]MBA9003843.1 hypothetical protein [Thermomonospora cellulosilytica]